jgi:hypothetical protein
MKYCSGKQGDKESKIMVIVRILMTKFGFKDKNIVKLILILIVGVVNHVTVINDELRL